MKKIFFNTATIFFFFSFLTSCNDTSSNHTVARPAEEATPANDTTTKINISIGKDGAGVNSKNTQIKIDSNGIKVGTKKINIDIK